MATWKAKWSGAAQKPSDVVYNQIVCDRVLSMIRKIYPKSLGLVNIYLFIHLLFIYDIILTAFLTIFSAWLYNY